MRSALQRKLNSRRGASLLLALLFFLLCSMVAASVLMAAVSNAGKRRSNLEEHQLYLAISSAVSLLCDELDRSEYRGKFEYTYYKEPVLDEEGEPTGEFKEVRTFQQLEGLYRHSGTEEDGYLKPLLLNDFDALFAATIQSTLNPGDFASFSTKFAAVLPHRLTLTPQTGTGLDEQEITVDLQVVEASYAIELTAALGQYQVRAELTPIANKPTVVLPSEEGTHTVTTEPMQWKIGWITTGGEEDEA